MKPRKLLDRFLSGSFQNVLFKDARSFLVAFGFKLKRVEGSHHIFAHSGVSELVNLQAVKGDAKPYQIRQALRLIERYNLQLEDEND